MAFKVDEWSIQVVSGGRLRLDGGNMFGVVPKVLWERHCPADAQNRILLETNCLLLRGHDRVVLVDTGYGNKASARERRNHDLAPEHPLLAHLAAVELSPADVDLVILTHLHFDHAGGATVRGEDGTLRATFPAARYVVQRREWEDATAKRPELAGAYSEQDVVPLDEAGQLDLVDGDAGLLPGLRVCLTGGHTRGHQVVLLGDRPQALYPADLCPLVPHLRTMWTMAYDQFPLDVRRTKARWLGEAADRGWLLLFDHDPHVQAARLARNDDGQVQLASTVDLEPDRGAGRPDREGGVR